MNKTINIMRLTASISTIVVLLILLLLDNDMLFGFSCLVPAVLYFLSWAIGERYEESFLGMKSTLLLSIIWIIIALINIPGF